MRRKFYMMMIAILCMASTAMADNSVRNLKLNVQKQLQSEKSIVKKQARTVAVMNAQVTPVQKNVSKLAGKKVVSMTKRAGESTSIEGTWTFQLGDWYGSSASQSSIYVDFEATLEDGKVWFEDPDDVEFPFVAEYDEATGTLTFKKEYLGPVNASGVGIVSLFQDPFVYTNKQEFQAITAIYDAAGIISFDPDNGIRWSAYQDETGNTYLGSFGSYDLEGAEKAIPWKELGEASFINNIVGGLFDIEQTTPTTHKITESPITPGIYKVYDPFSHLYSQIGLSGYVSPTMLIDATDPDNVKIELQSTGFSVQTQGSLYYFNEGWWCEEFGDDLDPDLKCTLTKSADGYATITIPYQSCTVYAPNDALGYYFYPGSDYESTLKFKLPAEEEEIFGDASIEGEWNFDLDWHYAGGGSWERGKVTDTYTATLDGNTVKFTATLGDNYNIVAKFTAENTLTFSKAAVVEGATFPFTQNPFTDGSKVKDAGIEAENFVFESFNATYDPEAGTITFPEGVGLAYGAANAETGEFSYYEDAFDFISASKAKGEEEETYEVVGQYPLTILPTDAEGVKDREPIDIQVEVRQNGDKYWIAEVEGNELEGLTVPFTYNEDTQMATFDQTYVGELGSENYYVWFAVFVANDGFIEAQPTYVAAFDIEKGFTWKNDEAGFAWYISSSSSVFEPYDVYTAFYVSTSDDDDEEGGEGDTDGLNKITTVKAVDVYSLDGKLIRKQATTLDGLKGLYIVNGKKVILQ